MLTVLAVTPDRQMSRYLTRCLSAFGYEVLQATDGQSALSAFRGYHIDFLLLDSELPQETQEQLFSQTGDRNADQSAYTIYLQDAEQESQDASEGSDWPADDMLKKPVVVGELLARLRAGARVLEYERRLQNLNGVDHVTGTLHVSEFHQRLAGAIALNSENTGAVAALDVDFFEGLTNAYGACVANRVLRQIADILNTHCTDGATLSRLENNLFAILLPGNNVQTAIAWANKAREEIASTDFQIGSEWPRITVSSAVASWGRGQVTPGDVIKRLREGVRNAKASGRNLVVDCQAIRQETSEMSDLALPGKLFENTTAIDIMTPVVLMLRGDDSLERATALFESTDLPALVTCDHGGKFLGVLTREDIEQLPAEDRESTQAQGYLQTDVKCFSDSANFSELMEFFTKNADSLAVVTEDEEPLGLINRNSLVALSMPLNDRSFAPRDARRSSSDYLRVPDLCAVGDVA